MHLYNHYCRVTFFANSQNSQNCSLRRFYPYLSTNTIFENPIFRMNQIMTSCVMKNYHKTIIIVWFYGRFVNSTSQPLHFLKINFANLDRSSYITTFKIRKKKELYSTWYICHVTQHTKHKQIEKATRKRQKTIIVVFKQN